MRKSGICTNRTNCECGYAACLKCGGIWHTLKCNYEGKAYKLWTITHSIGKSPGCKAQNDKNFDCNHITCVRCKNNLFWLCSKGFKNNESMEVTAMLAYTNVLWLDLVTAGVVFCCFKFSLYCHTCQLLCIFYLEENFKL